jgi:hypothetical protein
MCQFSQAVALNKTNGNKSKNIFDALCRYDIYLSVHKIY